VEMVVCALSVQFYEILASLAYISFNSGVDRIQGDPGTWMGKIYMRLLVSPVST